VPPPGSQGIIFSVDTSVAPVVLNVDFLLDEPAPGWGYEAIAVALIARLNPMAVVPSSVLFGALDNGAQAMQRTQGVSPVLVQVIEGLVIMILLAFDATAWNAFRDALWTPWPAAGENQHAPSTRSADESSTSLTHDS
jgi:ABC-type uncharacterized transport system permease subunit